MGWFENQIEERRISDDQRLEESLVGIADAITGYVRNGGADAADQAKNSLSAVLRYYGAKKADTDKIEKIEVDKENFDQYLENVLRPTGITCRPVSLRKGWYKDAVGAMLGFTEEGDPTALIPLPHGGYTCRDPHTGKNVRVSSKEAPALSDKAYCFYRPLPARAINIPDLLWHMFRSLDVTDYVFLIAATGLSTLLGTFTPAITRIIFGPVVNSGNTSLVLPVISLLIGVNVSSILLSVTSSLVNRRITRRLRIPLQAAIMMRVLSLPASFFADHQTGELNERVRAVTNLAESLQSTAFSTVLSSVFSIVYIAQIGAMTPVLMVPALGFIIASTAISLVSGIMQKRMTSANLKISSKLSSTQFSMIKGIQKIKLAGAEKRAYANWADAYAANARITYNPPTLVNLSGTIQTALSLAGTIVFYSVSIAAGIPAADYMAFTSAFGRVSSSFSSLSSAALTIAQIRPYLELAEPILKTAPESSVGKEQAGRLSGGFELDHVTFRYKEGLPTVLNDLSLKIKPGSYVAIVGKTGCGKSTLLRILLGFENPESGAVYYDGRDLQTMDMQSVRRNIGVVLQDGKLFQGSIYDNIAISAPGLTMDNAWKAAERAGIADDIREMPMGMQTLVTENGGGVSGGQRQRLMIARAVAGDPRIIMFDEATSALDNVTQRIVSDSLDELHCTRLVIAHRLSTIRHCDRIVLLDKGQIAEDGTYEELIAKGGMFADLVARQQV